MARLTPDADHPEVTVVIPAHNAGRTLRACLSSVFENRGVPFEVIVVDDASSDDSRDVALEFPCTVLRLERSIMAASCRNLGALHARGEILLFFDSDQVMPADMILSLTSTLRDHPEVAAAVASLAQDTPESGFFSKFKNLRHHHAHQEASVEGWTLASGLTAIRKPVFDHYGGFEPSFGPSSVEDIALGYRMSRDGRRIVFRPDVHVTHLKGYTLWSLIRSDVRDRAVPWTVLLLRDRMWRNDLDISLSKRASVALSGAILPAFLVLRGRRRVVVPALLAGSIAGLNWSLLQAASRRGPGFLLRSAAFLPVMYFAQGVGFVIGLIAHASGRSISKEAATDVRYELLRGASSASNGDGAAPDVVVRTH